jgi:hypothetical protein
MVLLVLVLIPCFRFSLPSDGDTKQGIKSTRHCVGNPCDAPCEAL